MLSCELLCPSASSPVIKPSILDNWCLCAIRYRMTTARIARQPSVALEPTRAPEVPLSCEVEELERICKLLVRGVETDTTEGDDGRVGTTVERTTYGQYERCSFSRSNWRLINMLLFLFGCCGEDASEASEGVAEGCFGGAKAHKPTRLWQRTQCTRDVSRAIAWDTAVCSKGLGLSGLPTGTTEVERESEGVREADGNLEFDRDVEVERGRSGATVHPNREVMMAVCEISEDDEWLPDFSKDVSGEGSKDEIADCNELS